MNALSALPRPLTSRPATAAPSAPTPPLDAFTRTPLELVPSRDAVLHAVASPVEKFDGTPRQLLESMSTVMRRKGGCGIAGPQVGIPYRLIIVDAGGKEERLANPRIVERSGISPSLEGCLSLPGRMGVVWRSSRVVVKAQDGDGRDVTIEARGLKSRCLQHEIDHLDGKLFPERAFLSGKNLLGVGLGVAVGAALPVPGGAALGAATGFAATWLIDRLTR